MPTAIITGASRGLGRALAHGLADQGYRLVIDARDASALEQARAELAKRTDVASIAGDITDAAHRAALVAQAGRRIDLVVNNAGVLGPSPQPALATYPLAELERCYRINVVAPLGLVQAALPHLTAEACVINITSDAAVEPYPGWGGYGSAKAALDQWTRILAAEHPRLRVYAVDPGDMRTRMHQDAFPGEDISDRPWPEAVVPAFVALITSARPSGRYRATELV